MSDHIQDEGTPIAHCTACGVPFYDESEYHVIPNFSGEGEHGYFCEHHYEKASGIGDD